MKHFNQKTKWKNGLLLLICCLIGLAFPLYAKVAEADEEVTIYAFSALD